ncbi:DUF916 domain-containing protein [Ligilactobacillus equi]|uniref:DUF916 domain-containing protein n=1 Tax=Ligilactobacillus equi TaxID=137357 RepID=UPI000467FA2A|nr:DUF916 domain-containing protein [Ligilactobacillus equi]
MKRILLFLGLVGGFFFGVNAPIQAASMNFTADPQTTDTSKGYFDFAAKPGQKQDLTVKVSNVSDHEITLNVDFLNALGNPSGGVAYVKQDQLENSKLTDSKRLASKYLHGPKEITLKPNETKMVTYTFEAPKDVSKGQIVGGLNFLEKATSQKMPAKNKKEVQINTQLAKMIAVVANFSKQQANLQVKEMTVSSSASSPFLNLHLINKVPQMAGDLQVDYTVKKMSGKKIGHAITAKSPIAAASDFKYQLAWPAKVYKPGTYKVDVNVTSKNPDQSFRHTYVVHVKNQDTKTYAQKSGQTSVQTHSPMMITIVIILLVIIVGLAGVIVRLMKK